MIYNEQIVNLVNEMVKTIETKYIGEWLWFH